MTEMEEALRSCMEQLVMTREEREQIIVEAANEISSEKKKVRELQRKLDDESKKVAKLAAENNGLCKSADAKDALIRELRESEAAARDQLADAAARLESAQKQAGSLQYEVRMLQKELEVRRQEREYDLQAADAARRQQAEHLSRIAQLEAECQRLRAMVRKRLPGPAAIAKMRDEVDPQLTPRSSPRRPRPATPSSPRSVSSFTPRTPSPRRSVSEAESCAFRLRAVEDENRALKQALAKRDSELQFVQMKYADEACNLTAVQRQLKELTEENRQLSEANGQSESWASALMSELEQFRSGNQNGASIMASDMRLLDDFAEIEKMEMAAGDRKKYSPHASPKKVDMGSVTQEQIDSDLAVKGSTPNSNPKKVHDIWELVIHKHESSGESVDTILEEIRHALDPKSISTREDSDVSYDLSEVEKVVKDLIEELASLISASAEDNVARYRQYLLIDKSELSSRLEHLLQVCHDLLHGKVNLEKFVDEVCQILKYTLSQYLSNQDQSYTVDRNTKNSDEGKSPSTINTEGQHSKDAHGAKPVAAVDIQQEAQDEPIRSAIGQVMASDQEKLNKEWVQGPDDDILPGRKSMYCEIKSPAAEASVEEWAAQEEERLAASKDILAAADKLAECQETITILNKQLQALRTPATHKPKSLGSILAEESADATGSRSPTTSKQVQFKEEQDAFCATPSPAPEQNATYEDKESIRIVVHPVFVQPRRESVSADPGNKKKRSPSLLGRIMFRKKAEGSS